MYFYLVFVTLLRNETKRVTDEFVYETFTILTHFFFFY